MMRVIHVVGPAGLFSESGVSSFLATRPCNLIRVSRPVAGAAPLRERTHTDAQTVAVPVASPSRVGVYK